MKAILSSVMALALIGLCAVAFQTIWAEEAPQEEANRFDGKVAFLKDGELCLSEKNGDMIGPLTQTGGEVDEFLFSPTLEYLAVNVTSSYTEGMGYFEDDEEVPQVKVFSVVVLDLASMDTLAVITPDEGWLSPVQWSSPNRLICIATSGYDVAGFLEYDIKTDTRRWLDYHEGRNMVFGDFSADGNLWSYIDYTGLGQSMHDRLHLVDMTSGKDTILWTNKNMFYPRISHDRRRVAFVDVRKIGEETFDNLWVYDLDRGTADSLCSWPALAKSDGGLCWSAGDSCLGVFYSGTAMAVALDDPANVHTFRSWVCCWLGDSGILLNRAQAIHLYDMQTKEETVFLEGASSPKYLCTSRR